MLGFLVFLPLWGSSLLAPHQEPETPSLAGLESLLAEARGGDRGWRVSVWEHLIALEQAESPLILQGWRALADSGSDPDRANLFLYQRRHGLARLAVQPEEGPELTLERCLVAWGDRDQGLTRALLEQALQRFPNDVRLAENLLWLDLAPPEPVWLDGSARHLALAVLAARRARG